MPVHEAVIRCDPQTAAVVPKHFLSSEFPSDRQRPCLDFTVDELSNSAVHGDPERAIIAFDQIVNLRYRGRRQITLRGIWLPSPEAGYRAYPEITPIFVECTHIAAKTAVLSITPDALVP